MNISLINSSSKWSDKEKDIALFLALQIPSSEERAPTTHHAPSPISSVEMSVDSSSTRDLTLISGQEKINGFTEALLNQVFHSTAQIREKDNKQAVYIYIPREGGEDPIHCLISKLGYKNLNKYIAMGKHTFVFRSPGQFLQKDFSLDGHHDSSNKRSNGERNWYHKKDQKIIKISNENLFAQKQLLDQLEIKPENPLFDNFIEIGNVMGSYSWQSEQKIDYNSSLKNHHYWAECKHYDNSIDRLDFNQQRAPFSLIVEIGKQIFNAIRYLHSHDFIHRDIKGTNIVYRWRREGIEAALTDFGTLALTPYKGTIPEGIHYLWPAGFQSALQQKQRIGLQNKCSDWFAYGMTLRSLIHSFLAKQLQRFFNEKNSAMVQQNASDVSTREFNTEEDETIGLFEEKLDATRWKKEEGPFQNQYLKSRKTNAFYVRNGKEWLHTIPESDEQKKGYEELLSLFKKHRILPNEEINQIKFINEIVIELVSPDTTFPSESFIRNRLDDLQQFNGGNSIEPPPPKRAKV